MISLVPRTGNTSSLVPGRNTGPIEAPCKNSEMWKNDVSRVYVCYCAYAHTRSSSWKGAGGEPELMGFPWMLTTLPRHPYSVEGVGPYAGPEVQVTQALGLHPSVAEVLPLGMVEVGRERR